MTIRAAFGSMIFLMSLITQLSCAAACPAGLLEGRLVRELETLVVVTPSGTIQPVDWSASGHRIVDKGNGGLEVVDVLLGTEAFEGEFVRLGGGENGQGVWVVCGLFEGEDLSGRVKNLDAVPVLDDVRPALRT